MRFVVLLFAATVAYGHTVAVTWTQSTDPTVAYNKVYRSHKASGGTWTLVHKGTAPETAWTDTKVFLNTTYCYAATAVDTNGQESGKSNVQCVKIPAQ